MKISVITASYNYAQYIEEAINSVINQSYSNWELIIVDDGSSDNSVEIIKRYCEKDSRIKLFQHENGQNKGLKETLLLGIGHASGDWIAFLESDDFFAPDNLSKKVEIINKNPSPKLIFNKVEIIREKDVTEKRQQDLEAIQNKLSKSNFPKNMFHEFYITNSILTFSCVMVETNALKNTDFDTPADTLLDWWLWIHLAYKNDFYYIDEKLTHWRLHAESYILKGKKPILYLVQAQAYEDIYQKNGKEAGLLLFIIYSKIKLFFIRGFRLIIRILGSKK
ncbi:MAG: glycosyltransferase [Candidatus Gastranaerophilaceae bacterium]